MVSPFPDGIDRAGVGRYIGANLTGANTLFYLFRCASAKNVGMERGIWGADAPPAATGVRDDAAALFKR